MSTDTPTVVTASEVTKFFGANAKLNRGLSIRYNRFRKLALDAMYH